MCERFFPFSILSRWWWFYCCCYCVCCSLYICNSFAIWIHSKITIYASSWRCRTRITTIRIEFKIMEIKSIHQTASMCDCEQRFYGVSWDEYWQKRQQSNGVNGIGICEALNSAYIFLYLFPFFILQLAELLMWRWWISHLKLAIIWCELLFIDKHMILHGDQCCRFHFEKSLVHTSAHKTVERN